jgi:hypothetical protein
MAGSSRKRTVALGLALFLLGAAGPLYLRLAEDRADLQQWLRSGRMAALNVNFSAPGEYSVSFEAQTVDPVLELELPKDVGLQMSAEDLLSGLRATTELIDSRGEVIYAGRIPEDTPRFFPPDSGRIRLVAYGYSGVERHRIDIEISQPAPALQGVPQRLVVASASARSGTGAPVCLGHAAWLTATLILAVVAVTSRGQRRQQPESQAKAQ